MKSVTELVVALSLVAGALHAQTPGRGQRLGTAARTAATTHQAGHGTLPFGAGFCAAALDELPAPNTRVSLPGVGYVVLNEQIASGGAGITVNMIHVVLQNALTGLTTGEIIVASAFSSVGN